MKAIEIINYLETIAPLTLQENFDNSGLIVGNDKEEIKGVLISLDATEDVIDEAIRLNCNLVISHHPILFKPIKKLNGNHYVERAVIKAIQNNILLYAIHTNLDNILQNGVNQEIANRIGLKELKILLPKPERNDIGSGIIGEFEKALEPNEFLTFIKEKLESNCIKYTPLGSKIQKVALCGGAGSFLIPAAMASNANVFITADVKYHEFFEATPETSIIDIGHYESEKFTIGLLYRLVTQKFSKFATHYTKINTNPVKYFNYG